MDLEAIILKKRQIPYDFIYTWNLKKKMNKNKTETGSQRKTAGCYRGVEERGWVKQKDEGIQINSFKINNLQGYNVQHREYSQ